jgi:hypothetical protein
MFKMSTTMTPDQIEHYKEILRNETDEQIENRERLNIENDFYRDDPDAREKLTLIRMEWQRRKGVRVTVGLI